jgi:MOSC domain-containing protein YiiM/ferredoxin-NADP reductase
MNDRPPAPEAQPVAKLISVNVGLPRPISWRGKTVNTAIWKAPAQGPRMVRHLNIDGDRQGDLSAHGGERKAVLVYQLDSYRFWAQHLNRGAFAYGQFGENFTVEGLADADVCIGDHYRVGDALFEVTQPRVTCYRLGIRMNQPDIAALLVKHARPGFYLRVLQEGVVEAGDEITKVMSGAAGISVADFNALLYLPGHPRAQLERVLEIPDLGSGWRRSFEALLREARSGRTIAGNAGLGAAPGLASAWTGFRPLRVMGKSLVSEHIVSLDLGSIDGTALPAALPGQYVVVRLGEPPALTRSYSLSGKPGSGSYRLSIKCEPHGTAGRYVTNVLQIGDVVQTSAPRGSFTLRPGTTPILLLSAGIGVTPLLAMLHDLAAARSQRQICWIHATRNRRQDPYPDEVKRLLSSLGHARSQISYSAPDPEDQSGVQFDRQGRLDAAALRQLDIPPDADCYVCGPSGFMSDMSDALVKQGIGRSQIHTENFGAVSTSISGIAASPHRAPHPPEGVPGAGPLVSFARSGLDIRWDQAHSSLLELAEACDVPVRWSCRSGACHTCETGLISGEVEYRPEPIDAPADGIILICCSRPRTDIVVDL